MAIVVRISFGCVPNEFQVGLRRPLDSDRRVASFQEPEFIRPVLQPKKDAPISFKITDSVL